jgi:hypothetical protein
MHYAVVDVDHDGEYVPDSSTCPFLPLSAETVLCFMHWYKYVRRFGCSCTDPGDSRRNDRTIRRTAHRTIRRTEAFAGVPFLLTDRYCRFLQYFHIKTGQPDVAGVVFNFSAYFTMDEVSYDTVACRLTEFIRHVYGTDDMPGCLPGSRPKIPEALYCWRDLCILMAVYATDDVCKEIVRMPPQVQALVCELAKRMNTHDGILRFNLPTVAVDSESDQESEEESEEESDEEGDEGTDREREAGRSTAKQSDEEIFDQDESDYRESEEDSDCMEDHRKMSA